MEQTSFFAREMYRWFVENLATSTHGVFHLGRDFTILLGYPMKTSGQRARVMLNVELFGQFDYSHVLVLVNKAAGCL